MKEIRDRSVKRLDQADPLAEKTEHDDEESRA